MSRDLTNLKIQDTYEYLLQISGSEVEDGLGNAVTNLNVTASNAITADTASFLLGNAQGVGHVDFADTAETTIERRINWNDTDGTLNVGLKGGNVTLQVGQEEVARVVNGTGANLLESQYRVVKVIGAQGQRLQVGLAKADLDINSATTIGIVTEDIANNQEGFITLSGLVRNINTTGALQGETWNDGDVLYLSGTTAGAITNVKPVSPLHLVTVGYVVYAHANNGKIFVKVDNGYELEELHDVLITAPSTGQALVRSGSLWVNQTITNVASASYAVSASEAAHAVSADSATNATSASYAVSASEASHAVSADSAATATSASYAVSSSYASTAVSSSYASNGGVTSIIAGTNVTIDQSTGDVTISATGGGGSAFPYTGSAIISGSLTVDGTTYLGKGAALMEVGVNEYGPGFTGSFINANSNINEFLFAAQNASITFENSNAPSPQPIIFNTSGSVNMNADQSIILAANNNEVKSIMYPPSTQKTFVDLNDGTRVEKLRFFGDGGEGYGDAFKAAMVFSSFTDSAETDGVDFGLGRYGTRMNIFNGGATTGWDYVYGSSFSGTVFGSRKAGYNSNYGDIRYNIYTSGSINWKFEMDPALYEWNFGSTAKSVQIDNNSTRLVHDTDIQLQGPVTIPTGNNMFIQGGDLQVTGSISATTDLTVAATGSIDHLTITGAATDILVITNYASMNFADDTAAAAGGVPLGGVYRNGNLLCVRIS